MAESVLSPPAAGNEAAAGSNGSAASIRARIGKYEVKAEIGHGALVRVFRGYDRDIGRPVTLKVLTDAADQPVRERFRREVASAANVHHPNLIGIYDLGEHVGLSFGALQYLGADDLREAIRGRRPLSLLQKTLIMWQVAEGVRAAHRGGLAYVGVRPSGIALGSDGSATIQDFGIVRLTGGGRDEVVSYASPEESTTDCLPDPLCDVFAFGTVYYELLTGTHPFRAGSPDDARFDVLRHEPVPLRDLAPECPEALERLVHRALDKHRGLRFQSFGEIQCDAEPILFALKRTRGAMLVADGRRLMNARQLDEAQGVVREALEVDPDNRQAHRLQRTVRGLLQRRMVRSRQVDLLREAAEEADARRFRRAVEILQSALGLDDSNPDVSARLEQACALLEQSERAEGLVAEARRLLDQQALTEAHEKAWAALECDPQSEEAAGLLHVIADAIRRRDREARVERELGKAEELLQQQAFDDALAILAGLCSDHPGSPVIEHRLVEARAQKTRAERQARFLLQLSEVESLLQEQQFAAAVAKLEALSAEFPERRHLPDLLVQAREAMERASTVAQAIAQCEPLRRQEQFEAALAVLDAALSAYPGMPSLLELRREVEEQWRGLQTAAAVRAALEEADWLLEQNRPDLAVQFLREKSAEFPDQTALVCRLTSLEEMLPGWEQCRFIQDSLGRAAALEQLGHCSVAFTLLEEALSAYPASEELIEAAGRLRSRLREQERQKKLARLLEMIGRKVAAQAWPDALALIESAQEEFPDVAELRSLRDEARGGLRRSACENTVTEARRCLADGEAAQAEEILRTALESWGEEPALQGLRQELEAERQYRDEWKKAQVLFGRRQFREAEQVLVRLAEENRGDARALLATVREARAATEEEHFYERGREKALQLIQQRQFAQAADLLRNLLSLFPGDPILERDLRSAQGGRIPEQQETAVAAPEVAGNAQTPAQPPLETAPLFLTAPAGGLLSRLGGRTIIAAALFLLVSLSAAVWTSSRNESRSPAPRPAPSSAGAGRTEPQGEPTPLPRGAGFQEPKLIRAPSPVIPPLAREQGISGSVDLEATVDKQGKVSRVTVLSGHPLLAAAAATAVQKRRYRPATRNGQPLEVKIPVQIRFEAGRN